MAWVTECGVCGCTTLDKPMCYACAYDLVTGKTRQQAKQARYKERMIAARDAVEKALRPTYEQLEERVRQLGPLCAWCGSPVKNTINRKPWRGEWKCGSVKHGPKPYQMPQCRIVELENTVERLEAEIESLQGLLKDALAEPKNHEIAKLRADLAIWQDNSAELEECLTILKAEAEQSKAALKGQHET